MTRIIKKFTIITSSSRSGQDVHAFIRVLTSMNKLDRVAEEVVKFDEVKQACFLAGQCGVALIVRVPSVEALNEFIREKLADIEGVTGIETCIILQELKRVLEI
ncbi:MAG: Lrp/AsnC family transcriptional regulator [Candidatus Baldrarchaeota archaeon]